MAQIQCQAVLQNFIHLWQQYNSCAGATDTFVSTHISDDFIKIAAVMFLLRNALGIQQIRPIGCSMPLRWCSRSISACVTQTVYDRERPGIRFKDIQPLGERRRPCPGTGARAFNALHGGGRVASNGREPSDSIGATLPPDRVISTEGFASRRHRMLAVAAVGLIVTSAEQFPSLDLREANFLSYAANVLTRKFTSHLLHHYDPLYHHLHHYGHHPA
jgi:hypothetical protein